MSLEDVAKQFEQEIEKTVEERLYLIEQALERALGVNLAQFDPNPAKAAAAVAPEAPAEPAPAVPAPVAEPVDETGANDVVPPAKTAPKTASA